MISNLKSHIIIAASLFVLTLSPFGAASAQDKAPLPDYVIEEFGSPPAVPDGPLSEALQSAVTVAFVDSMERTTWQEPQIDALEEIVAANDPRVAWLIADLMRFAPSRQLNSDLSDAAFVDDLFRQGNGRATAIVVVNIVADISCFSLL